ncbi:MAG: pilin [Gammaproteobacteria bacterium]
MKKIVIALSLVVVCVVAWPFLSGLTSGLFGSISGDLAIRREIIKGLEAAKPFQAAVTKRYTESSFVCTSNESCDMEDVGARRFSIAIGKRAAITVTYSAINPGVDGRTVVLKPLKSGDALKWDCKGGTLQALYRPAACRAKRAAEG